MRKRFPLAALTVLLIACVRPNAEPLTFGHNRSVESDVVAAFEKWNDAVRTNDADALERLYADDYVFVNYRGGVSSKAEQVEAVRSGAS